MIVLGITGPTGSGKTTLLHQVEAREGCVLDLDAIYHELLATDKRMLEDLEDRFPGVIREGRLDRKALGSIVFADPAALKDLGAITGSYILAETDRRLAQAKARGVPLAAIDAINLLEGDLPDRCDCTIAVIAPVETRIQRIMARDGISEEYARLRVSAQKPGEYFSERCDYTLVNDTTREAFAARCDTLLSQILGSDMPVQKEGFFMSDKYESERKDLLYKPTNGYKLIDEKEGEVLEAYARRYMDFLDAAKTEREAVREAIRQAEAQGFTAYAPGMPLTPGVKVYQAVHGRAINLAIIGKKPLSQGARIAAAHIDNPRLDLKPNPLYEDDGMAFFQTHYYGGIKKYQWTTVPMALHGVIVKRDGTQVEICVGEKDDDPVFIVTDLLIHLSEAQMKKPLSTGVTAENLNVLVGSIPLPEDEGSDSVKLAILMFLNQQYGITEEDLLSAELKMTPASKAREVGFDRSMIAAFGHDDRSCSFAALDALLALEEIPEYTAVCCLADKEEIGSMGVSGMQSQAFEYFMDCLCDAQGVKLLECFKNSECLSADVTNAYDPTWPDVCDKANSAHLGCGVCFSKYTGSRGKSGSSEAPAEFVAKIRRLCHEGGVAWQMGELGKVDAGGGGTVAQYMANRNILTLDTGVPVLSMHAPIEVVSKMDCYMTRKAMKVFFEDR